MPPLALAAAAILVALAPPTTSETPAAPTSTEPAPPPATPAAEPALERARGAADLRPSLQTWQLGPREQGGRGTCSVFAVTEALEFALARHAPPTDGPATRLSVEFLNWASNDAIGHAADGGFFGDLWKGFEKHGICAESDCPYRDRFDAAPPPPEAVAAAARIRDLGWSIHWIKTWDVTTGLSDGEVDGILRTLDEGTPVCAGMRWPKACRWEGARLGWAEPDQVFDGHSVLLVGYRPADAAAPAEGRTFLVRNSSAALPELEIPERYLRAYVNDAVWFACADGR